ncbi:immunoglobulin domain-containing protein [Haloferula sp. BvORR071]|uniref:immunoglobulin domain-containing protein n=1 Tax=Haloferula sp. BvORR071 TaxID=1396141 RepID=UPI0005567319|nr:immunoglobulin domain-containing protein [Haloferula sp. BvORR071]
MIRLSPLRGRAAVVYAGLLLPVSLQAAQMAYEGFNYPTGTSNLSASYGGSGWNGTWATVNNGSADVTLGSMVAGANAPAGYDVRSIGNSCLLPNQRRVGRALDVSATGPFGSRGYRDANGRIGADGKTVYISFVQQANGTSAYYEFELHRGDLGDGGRIGGIGNDQGGDNVNLRAPNGTHTVIGAGNTGVNFYVMRIDFKAGNDDVYVYRNPISLTEPGVPTLTKLGAADMSFDGISFGAFNNGRTIAHDEVRLGESWADVVVPSNAQPVITQQPRAASKSFTGGTVTLQADATGQPLPTYQWYHGVTPLSGQTGSTLTLSNIQAGDAGAYHVVATNSQGSVPSSDAQITVVAPTAGLMAYEGFDYDAGPANLPTKAGGLGWGAPWTAVNGAGTTVVSGSLVAGTNAPNGYDAQSLANSAFTTNGRREGRSLDVSPSGPFGTAGYIDGSGNIGADGKTVYISFLQQPDGTTKFYEFEFHRDDLGDPGRIGGVGNDTGNPTVALRTGGTQSVFGPGSTGVNFYVVRIDFKPGNDDVYVYQNPISATEPGTPTFVKLAASDMSFDGLSIAAFDNGRTVKHDEIRVGKSWSDVVFGTSRRDLTWVGDGVSNNWNTTTANWSAGSGATTFVDGDPVTFSDTGSDTPAVNIPVNVSTGTVIVNSGTKNYTLGGAGTIQCSGGLTKSGTGSLTLAGKANFSSAVAISDGTLALSGTVSVGGGLNANGGTTNLSGTNSLVGLVSTNGNLTITGPTTITGTGPFVWVGNFPGANSTLTMQAGGSLTVSGSLGDSWVVGRDGGVGAIVQTGGTITYNPPNRGEAYLGASTSPATSGSYTISGGTLEMSGKRLTLALGPVTSQFDQNGGTVNLGQLHLGANLSQGNGTGIYHLTAGDLTIGAGGITSQSLLYEIKLAGGSVHASANWNSSLAMELSAGNVTFDTAANRVGLSGELSGTGSLSKTGTGTLVLGGFNSYSGTTTVSAGTVAGVGNDQSAITVAAGAALEPGDNSIGTMYGSSVTFAAGSALNIGIDSDAEFVDQLSSLGAINLGGASLNLAETTVGAIPIGNQLLIVEGGSVTGTFAGLPEGASVVAGGSTYSIHYTSTQVQLTMVSGSPYLTWASSKGLDGSPGKEAGFSDDPEHDGISNGLEWILGGDPLASDPSSLVTTSASAGDGLTLNFHRAEASIGATTLVAQWSANLGATWNDVPVTQAGGSYPNGVTVSVSEENTPDAVTVHIPASNASGGKLFARLKATMP